MIRPFSQLFLSFTLIFLCTRFSEAQWANLGLGERYCTGIRLSDNAIYAGTGDGIYKKAIAGNDTTWDHLGPEGSRITDFIVFSEDTILAATQPDNPGDENPSIYMTFDGGSNWENFQNGFGGTAVITCYALAHDTVAPDTLFGRASMAIARSTNRGESWTVVYQEWDGIGYQSFLFDVNIGSGVAWAGGENAIFQPYLLKSVDHGTNWQFIGIDAGGDNACYSMVIHPAYPDSILVGMEGRIISTGDGGENWEQIFSAPSYPYVIAMEESPRNPELVYATGSYNGNSGGPLFFYLSADFGRSWDTVFHSDGEADYFVSGLEIREEGGSDALYFSTNRGVYRYIHSGTGVGEFKSQRKVLCTIHPNPCTDLTTITLHHTGSDRHMLLIFDSSGKMVRQIRDIPQGETVIHREDLRDGIYHFQVRSKGKPLSSGSIIFR